MLKAPLEVAAGIQLYEKLSHHIFTHLTDLPHIFPTSQLEVTRTMSSVRKYPEKLTKEGREVREGA